jgi:uncharacterized protein (DUF885 family)
VIAQTRALLDSGLAVGVTPPRVTLRDVPAQFDQLVPEAPMQSALLEPFTRFPPRDRVGRQTAAHRAGHSRLRGARPPAYRALASYLSSTYIPRARQSVAWSSLPDGRAWYAYNVKLETTTSRTPAEIPRSASPR